ncbi:MAG: ATP-binding protein [Oscillochloridaceae bacterium umkhey_bin13]
MKLKPPPTPFEANPLEDWRQRTLLLLLRVLVFLGIPIILVDVVNQFRLGGSRIWIWELILIGLILILAFTPTMMHQWRSGLLLGAMLITALNGIASVGLFGVSPTLLIAVAMLAVVLIGQRAATVAGVIASLGLALILLGFGQGWLAYPPEPVRISDMGQILLTNWVLISGVAAVMTIMLGSLVANLQRSLHATQHVLAELRSLNAELDATVEQRTGEVREMAALLAASQRIAHLGGVVFDPAGNAITWTDELYRIHAVPPGTLIDRAMIKRLYANSFPQLQAAIAQLATSDQPLDLELEARTFTGEPIWVRVSAVAEVGPHGRRLIGVAQDITARKADQARVAEQLRYAETLTRCSGLLLMPVANQAAFEQTLAQVLNLVREAVSGDHLSLSRYSGPLDSVTGLPTNYEVFANSYGPACPPQRSPTMAELRDLPPIMNVWQLAGGSFNGPVTQRFPLHPAFMRWCEDNQIQSILIQPLTIAGRWWGHVKLLDCHQARRWSDGAFWLIQTVSEMVVSFSESWTTAQALQEREAFLHEVGQLARVGSWSLDHATQQVRWTEQVFLIHELPLGTPPPLDQAVNFYAPEGRPLLEAAMQACIDHDQTWDLELPFITAKGRRIWVRVQGQAVRTQGRLLRLQGAIQEITARKEADLALAASEAKYRTLFAMLPVGVTLANQRGAVLEVNLASEQILGLSANAYQARSYDNPDWDAIKPDGSPFPPDEMPIMRAIREQQPVRNSEIGIRNAAGGRTWIAVSAAPLDLEPYAVLVTYTDITARKEAELALARQLRYAEALANCSRLILVSGIHAPAWEPVVEYGIATLRRAVGCDRISLNFFTDLTRILRIADAVEGDLSLQEPNSYALPFPFAQIPTPLIEVMKRGMLVAGQVEDIFPPPSLLYRYFTSRQRQSILLIGIQIGGQWRGYLIATDHRPATIWDEPTCQLLRTGVEMITAFIHQWETSRALQASEAQLRALGDNLPNGFIFQLRRDEQWHPSFTYLSQGVSHVMGVEAELLLHDGTHFYARLVDEDRARIEQIERVSGEKLHDFSEVARYTMPSGTVRWLYLSARPREQAPGVIIWDGLALDVTERQQAAEELERARDAAEAAARAKSEFLASMSHEIRTPLNAVLGMAALLRDTYLTSEQHNLVETISTGGNALLAVISDILDFSRIEAAHLELEHAPFALHRCLQATLDLMAHEAQRKGLLLKALIAPSVPTGVWGDEARLRQVLLNLLSNAVKFTHQGSVTLVAEAEPMPDGQVLVRLSVRDTGIGISAPQLERIFEPFVQADSSTARRYGGTGLGLAISRRLVDLMDGQLTVVSQVNHGSTFTLELPMHTAQVLPESAPSPLTQSQPIRQLRMLVAEDNPLNQEVIRQLLTRLGHEPIIVSNGLAAVQIVQTQPFDVIFMDIQMPDLDGLMATRQIRQLETAITQPYIIALTANAIQGDREQVLEAGMDDYLSKPIQPKSLQQALERVPGTDSAPLDELPANDAFSVTLIDEQQLAELEATFGDEAQPMLAGLVALFATSVPPQLEAIATAQHAGEASELRYAAHRLRGTCLQLGAQAMVELCSQLERNAAPEAWAELVAELHAVYAATLAVLRRQYPS